MNTLKIDKKAQVIASLVEGNSIRATCRMTGVAKGTVLKLLGEVGKACAEYQDKAFVALSCKRVQCDEIWSFCGSKEKNVPKSQKGKFGRGDVWTYTAICADTKLVPTWYIGRRDITSTVNFMKNLAKRLEGRIQLTTDGNIAYMDAVRFAFRGEIDYMMLHKLYGYDYTKRSDTRYSPAACIGIEKRLMSGQPDPEHVSTSFVERQNLTMRMSMRRFTRLTNAFSKKVDNLSHAVALHFMHYNFCRIHQSLRITPAMAAGVTDRVWKIEDILKLLGSPVDTYPKIGQV